jgi:hypothetical protein
MLFTRFGDGPADALRTLSIDHGTRFDRPENLKVADAGGRLRPAEAADYTHVRWTFRQALAPGAQGSVSYRAQLQ